ncbi:hypothetical protein DFH07DRAFT_832914 [Mycena maculata]|uniref:DUF6533 domain-containing protein n=1 Tax=Mycena maculata TaxID=230809 RepID=A0AAD7INW8_9AGAR|nr:hypothetical protein DFH07DRAFT_832914 [Mycena maculata]
MTPVPLRSLAIMTMSESNSATGGLDYATFAWDHIIYRYIFLSALVILVYDHILSFPSEVEIIWSSKLRPTSYWFLAVRYLSLVCSATFAVFYFTDLGPEVCSKVERVLEALLLLQEGLVELTLALRVFAMYGFNVWVLTAMFIVGNAAAALGLWTEISLGDPQEFAPPGFTGCHTALPKAVAIRSAAAWEAQLLLDILVFGLTLRRAFVERSVIALVQGSLIERMARDGAMYFGIIVLANVANVFTLYFGDIIIAGILNWPTTSLSVALICRLMLNLQKAGIGNSQNETTELEDIHFVGQNSRHMRPTDDPLVSLADV